MNIGRACTSIITCIIMLRANNIINVGHLNGEQLISHRQRSTMMVVAIVLLENGFECSRVSFTLTGHLNILLNVPVPLRLIRFPRSSRLDIIDRSNGNTFHITINVHKNHFPSFVLSLLFCHQIFHHINVNVSIVLENEPMGNGYSTDFPKML